MVLRRQGDGTEVYVAQRIGQCAAQGDAAGVETWKAIAQRIDEIRRPKGEA